MFIAHLPAGYLAARLAGPALGATPMFALILAGMAGAGLPDLDLIYAALADGGRVHHHRYWTHLPVFWLGLSLMAALAFGMAGRHLTAAHPHLAGVFLLGAWSHLLLDSVAGDIWWLRPWLDTPFSLVHIPLVHFPWWLNYLLHWTAGLELAIVALALGWEILRPVRPRWNWRPA